MVWDGEVACMAEGPSSITEEYWSTGVGRLQSGYSGCEEGRQDGESKIPSPAEVVNEIGL